ncbi:MAG: winged helix-turn-helix domain-containing protein [Hyphomicrobium sp.]|nr:winged helix-turn-helix domain-containing protein [Hyphomicrobium sp.]
MIYVIGPVSIDTQAYEVRRDGAPVGVEPQVFDLLVLLIENRDRIVTRDEIIERVWKGRIVSEAAISSRIKVARRVIGEDGTAQGLIKTIHRRGLRFVGEVLIDTESRSAAADAETVPAPTIGHRLLLGSDGASPSDLTLTTPSMETQLVNSDTASGLDLSLPNRPSLVVLPFAVLGGDEHGRVIADGLTLDIMTRLARTRWLFVISRGTAFMFRGTLQDTRSISQKLGVRYVVQGNVQFLGQRVRVNAALTDAISEREVWADHFDRGIDDIFAIQDDIANIIVGSVESEIEQSERQRALLKHPATLDAWSAYHRATWLMYQFTPGAYEEAERLFKLSAKLDPHAARVYAGLSFVHWQRAFLEISKDRESEVQRALEYAQQALSIDPREPQAHWALGRAYLLQRDFDLALEEIGLSIELSPSFALGHYSSAFAKLLSGDYAGSVGSVRTARRLSPYDIMSFAMIALEAFDAAVAGNNELAATLADRAARQPNAHYHILAIAAFCNSLAGRDAAARQYIDRLGKVHPGYRISDYFQAFPYREDTLKGRMRNELRRLGLPE